MSEYAAVRELFSLTRTDGVLPPLPQPPLSTPLGLPQLLVLISLSKLNVMVIVEDIYTPHLCAIVFYTTSVGPG